MTPDAPHRSFRVVSHKPGILRVFEPFGGIADMGLNVDSDTAAWDLWWMSQDWAIQVLNAGIALPQLTSPQPGFIAGLADKWRNREVGTLLKRDIPRFFAKHPEYTAAHPKVVLSTPGEHSELMTPEVCLAEDLAENHLPNFEHLPGDTLLQLDAMLPCVVEVRCWIANGEVTAFAPYRIGMVGWDSNLFQEMTFNTEGIKLTEQAVAFARQMVTEIDGPPGYAVDIGITLTGTPTVLRAWPAWATDPLHAEPSGVFRALSASHDFDHRHDRWRWNPDPRIYNRTTNQESTA